MAEINLSNPDARDAIVLAESVRIDEPVRYLGPKGGDARTRRVLKSTVDHDLDAMLERFGDPAALATALVEGDPEIDRERFGRFLRRTSRVYVDPSETMVFRIRQTEQIRDPRGKLIRTRERERLEPNVESETPLVWTGTRVRKADAVRRYVFGHKLQVLHVNGLTYDFLHAMAAELAEADELVLLGAGPTGRDPLVFRRGSVPYRGFLEGRIDGPRYTLILHLSNLELRPADKVSA